ncbi:TetR/AcrR family transcriptional regulator [Vallitalea pronyensis]|uniref:TetR/AcrR family transcriptional regulator n=1 Tax=Vallitalea pronyensis TaxID=1348613 RepID=A0A8J8MNC5_9FIRM|nr:TetR/AcrR family transcriptional regulator [Vallitalea pronyensis]QUI24398.1 TetR/AcrR family transcriptional regulator [Vallitalea pronyensis]
MGISNRREREKKELRKKIFDSASQLIIEHGYEKFSIRKLANAIEYSPAMIYNYFKNKDDIIAAITLDNFERISKELLGLDFENMTPPIALKTSLLTLAKLILSHREQFKATLLSGVNYANTKSIDNEAIDGLITILDKGVASSDFCIDHTKDTAFLLITGIFGVLNIIVLSNLYDDTMIEHRLNAFVDLMINGVTK